MTGSKSFAKYEWQLAWAYLRTKRRDGGISIMTLISFFGITLAVFSLIVTLAVRSGFRYEFLQTILGANAHISVYNPVDLSKDSSNNRMIINYDNLVKNISSLKNVKLAAPIINGQIMVASESNNLGVEVIGIQPDDLKQIPLIANPKLEVGDLSEFNNGVAIGSGIARKLHLLPGDEIKLISPNGLKTAFGTVPRVQNFEVVYIFQVGRFDIDSTRVYMPFQAAQKYFNKDLGADVIEIFVSDPDDIQKTVLKLANLVNPGSVFWTWKDKSGAFLNALEVEDNVMFIILALLVLIASLNIVSGLIMLVKNKSRDIGILRTIGLSEGSILRIFFICGSSIGVAGTIFGTFFGCLFVIYIDQIFTFISALRGADVWDPSVRYLSKLPARLELHDVVKAIILSISLSFVVTFFPARRAARSSPVEALRNE